MESFTRETIDTSAAQSNAGLRRLLRELDAPDVDSAMHAIVTLKAQAAISHSIGQSSPGLPSVDTQKVLEKFRSFASRIDSLNGTIASMEAQLQTLYADRERLENEIGASEVDDVIDAFAAMRLVIQSMESQLTQFYVEREALDRTLGKSESAEIIQMFERASHLAHRLQNELTQNGAPSTASH